MTVRMSTRARNIEPFHVMQILQQAKQLEAQGRSIIHMEIGEPDFPSADVVIQAGRQALDDKLTQYTAANGLPELRHAIADIYQALTEARPYRDPMPMTKVYAILNDMAQKNELDQDHLNTMIEKKIL